MTTVLRFAVTLLLLRVASADAQVARWSTGHSSAFMGEKYSQDLRSSDGTPYPDWDPAEERCPLSPTNAVLLATRAASAAFTNAQAWRLSALSLQNQCHLGDSGVWHYEVVLWPDFGTNRPETASCIRIIVGLNGHVPDIKKTGQLSDEATSTNRPSYAERRRQRLAELEERRKKMADTPTPPEELERKLQEYQTELIRKGNPPLPIPLTREMDDQLVKEGVLPPAKEDDENVQPDK